MPRRKKRVQRTPRYRLRLFVLRAEELSKRRLVTDGMEWETKISWNQGDPNIQIRAPEVDPDLLRSFLVDFRHFISNDEPVFMPAILNLCARHIRSEERKRAILQFKEDWLQFYQGTGALNLSVNGQNISPERVLRLWINGYFFHNDEDDVRELHRLMGYSWNLTYPQFLQSLPGLTDIIIYMANFINYALQSDQFDFPDEEAPTEAGASVTES